MQCSEFWLEGARNSEKAELVRREPLYPLPLEHAVPACSNFSFYRYIY